MRKLLSLLSVCAVMVACGCDVQEVPGAIGKARENDPCKEEGKYACEQSGDPERELVCTDGRFEVSQECPGGCMVEEVQDKTLLQCYGQDGQPK